MQNIVLLHGALGIAEDLAPLSEFLKKDGFTVHSFSLSGHGKTAFKTNFDINQFALELEEFLNTNSIKNANIFGYSMGGFIALYLAARQKNLIQKIVTLGTKFDWGKASVEKETKMLDPEVIQQKVPGFAKLLEIKHGPNWKELLIKTAGLMRNIEQENLLNPEQLKEITIPVLLGIGDKDQMVSLDETTAVFKTLPDSFMYMLPSTKHPVETVNVELLGKLIGDFMKK